MMIRPFPASRLRALSFSAALTALAAMGVVASSAAPRNAARNADGIPAPAAAPTPAPPTVTLTTTYGFSTPAPTTGDNVDGVEPSALIPDGMGNFLGAADNGGASGDGTIFKIGPDGTFTLVHTLSSAIDGSLPTAGLTADGQGNFYGTASTGGPGGGGVVYKLTAMGTYSVMHAFLLGGKGGDAGGTFPVSALVTDGAGNFYGTTTSGGTGGNGTVYRLGSDGTFATLYRFTGYPDGSDPATALVPDGKVGFLGLTAEGGTGFDGTIYRITPAGTYTLLYNFSSTNSSNNGNNDGVSPNSALVSDGQGNFYGVAPEGGLSARGTVFKFTTDGTLTGSVLTPLHSFSTTTPIDDTGLSSNTDGANPQAPLLYGLDGNLYGTTQNAGPNGYGTIFEITPDGLTFLPLYAFTAGNDGASPLTALTQTTTTDFYGTTPQFSLDGGVPSFEPAASSGGATSTMNGTVFHLSVIPAAGVIGYISFQAGDTEVFENEGTTDTTFEVVRTGGSTGAVSVNYTTVDGTAKAGVDYTPASGTFSWADGDMSSIKLITVPIIDRHLTSGSASFQLVLSAPTGGAVLFGTSDTANTKTITILDNDTPVPVVNSPPSFSISQGVPFSYQITATNNPTSFGASNLPTGLTVDGTTGIISGTPTVTGTFMATVTATNAGGTGSEVVTLTVIPPIGGPGNSPVITSSTSASGQVGVAFSYQIVASNTPTAYSATGLPTGLGLNGMTGLISGTPTAAGSFTAVLTAANAGGSGAVSVTFTIAAASVPKPVITSAASASAVVGLPFAYQITATNSPTSYGTGPLPDGLSVNIATGLISGTPTTAGTYTVRLFAADTGGTGTGTLQLGITASQGQATLAITSPPDGITVVAGETLPLSASFTDPDSAITGVQFLVNGAPVDTANTDGLYTATATAPAAAVGTTVPVAVTAQDAAGRTFSAVVHVSVIAVDPANLVPTVSLLTPLNARVLDANATLTVTATADAPVSAVGLDHVNILVDGEIIASFDALGNLLTSAHGGGKPVRQDAASTPLPKLFTTTYQMPGVNKLLAMIVAATDKLGHTSISNVTSFHSLVTTDRAPSVSFANAGALAKLTVGSVNAVNIVANDPDASATSSAGRGPVRQDAASDATLAELEYWINGQKVADATKAAGMDTAALSYSFAAPAVGKYVFHAVSTDASGLATVSDPVIVEVDPPVVSVLALGDKEAVEGGEAGKVAIQRTGTSTAPLTVRYKVAGSAKSGTDYKAGPVTGMAVIPAGATQVKVKIKPIDNTIVDGTRVAKVKLLPSLDGSYTLGTATVGKIKIIDND